MNCDLILVLDKGNVIEFGTPAKLLEMDGNFFTTLSLKYIITVKKRYIYITSNCSGEFAHLVDETGDEFARQLRDVAVKSR